MEKKTKKLIGLPIGLAAFSVGSGIIGEALNSQPLKDAGTASGNYVAPAVNIASAGLVINQLRGLRKVKNK